MSTPDLQRLAELVAALIGPPSMGEGFPNPVASLFQAGNTTLITAQGLFIYNGTPASGNLILSIAVAGGTDAFGNVYGPGLTSFGAMGSAAQITSAVVGLFAGINVVCELTAQGFFLYSPFGGAGNLIVSIASAAGTDPFGNVYPKGLNVTQGTISGTTFNGTNFIINSSGEFFYSGTPALGNLVASFAPAAGTDTFGNVFKEGSVSYKGTAATQLHVNATNSIPAIEMFTGLTSEFQQGSLYTFFANSGAVNEIINTRLQGPKSTFDQNNVSVVLVSAAKNGSSAAGGQLYYNNTVQAFWDVQGVHVNATLLGTGGVLTLGDALKLTSIGAPATPSGGVILYGDALGNVQRLMPSGRHATLSDSSTSTFPFTVTAAASTALSNAWTFPANDAQVGTKYRIKGSGWGTWGSTVQNLSFGPGFATQTRTETFSSADFAASAGFEFEYEYTLTIISTGTTGKAWMQSRMTISGVGASHTLTAGQATALCGSNGSSAGETINTTVSSTMTFFASWASTTGAPTLTCTENSFERLGP